MGFNSSWAAVGSVEGEVGVCGLSSSAEPEVNFETDGCSRYSSGGSEATFGRVTPIAATSRAKVVEVELARSGLGKR